MQCLVSLFSLFPFPTFSFPTFWHFPSGGLSKSKKAAKVWAENEDQAQNLYDNGCYHTEEEGGEQEDVGSEINQLLPSLWETNAPL